jgi:hypothetical protein
MRIRSASQCRLLIVPHRNAAQHAGGSAEAEAARGHNRFGTVYSTCLLIGTRMILGQPPNVVVRVCVRCVSSTLLRCSRTLWSWAGAFVVAARQLEALRLHCAVLWPRTAVDHLRLDPQHHRKQKHPRRADARGAHSDARVCVRACVHAWCACVRARARLRRVCVCVNRASLFMRVRSCVCAAHRGSRRADGRARAAAAALGQATRLLPLHVAAVARDGGPFNVPRRVGEAADGGHPARARTRMRARAHACARAHTQVSMFMHHDLLIHCALFSTMTPRMLEIVVISLERRYRGVLYGTVWYWGTAGYCRVL